MPALQISNREFECINDTTMVVKHILTITTGHIFLLSNKGREWAVNTDVDGNYNGKPFIRVKPRIIRKEHFWYYNIEKGNLSYGDRKKTEAECRAVKQVVDASGHFVSELYVKFIYIGVTTVTYNEDENRGEINVHPAEDPGLRGEGDHEVAAGDLHIHGD